MHRLHIKMKLGDIPCTSAKLCVESSPAAEAYERRSIAARSDTGAIARTAAVAAFRDGKFIP
jgi:hypothetical protein